MPGLGLLAEAEVVGKIVVLVEVDCIVENFPACLQARNTSTNIYPSHIAPNLRLNMRPTASYFIMDFEVIRAIISPKRIMLLTIPMTILHFWICLLVFINI